MAVVVAPTVAPVVEEIVGYVIVEGVSYLLRKIVDEAGNFLWQLFTDEDGDYLPDDPENPWDTWVDEPDEWFPLPELPPASEPAEEIANVIAIAPEGPIILYADPTAEDYQEIVSQANEQWIELYGATVKPFNGYSVSEALLFIIAGCALFLLFGKIFKRRKF